MLKRLGPLLIVATLLAAGCSADPIPESEKILLETSSSPLGPTDGKRQAENKRAEPARKKKAKRKRIVARQSGISFLAPTGATGMSDGSLSFAADSPAGQEFAERAGVTVEQLSEILTTTEVLLLVFAGVISVSPWDNSGVLPSGASIEAQVGDLGYTVDDEEDVETPLGAGRIITYTHTDSSGQVRGASLYVLSGSTVADVGIVGVDQGAVRAVLDQIIPTLRRA